jgi:hypothetical protein
MNPDNAPLSPYTAAKTGGWLSTVFGTGQGSWQPLAFHSCCNSSPDSERLLVPRLFTSAITGWYSSVGWVPLVHLDMHSIEGPNRHPHTCLDGHLLAWPQLKPEPVKQAHKSQASLLEGKAQACASPANKEQGTCTHQCRCPQACDAYQVCRYGYGPSKIQLDRVPSLPICDVAIVSASGDRRACAHLKRTTTSVKQQGTPLTLLLGQRARRRWPWQLEARCPHAQAGSGRAGTLRHVATVTRHGAGTRQAPRCMSPWGSCVHVWRGAQPL